MARLGSWDPIAVAREWFDIAALSSGWVDRDVVPFPSQGLGPNPLLLLGGAEHCDDYFFECDENGAGIAWELGIEGYGPHVSFERFEYKILDAQRDDEKKTQFRQMIQTFADERAEKLKMVKQAITIAGVTYIVWRIIMWV